MLESEAFAWQSSGSTSDLSHASADADGDGSLSEDELAQILKDTGDSSSFMTIDSNGDGGVSPDEFKDYSLTLSSADANDDGSLGQDELEQHQKLYGGSSSLAAIDSNSDGSISEAEFDAYQAFRSSGECNLETLGPMIDVLITCITILVGVGLIRAILVLFISRGYKREVPIDLRFPLWEVIISPVSGGILVPFQS